MADRPSVHALEPTRPAKARPDPTSMRLAIGAAGLAALSGLVTGVVRMPTTSPAAAPTSSIMAPTPETVTQQRPVRYVQLAAGQTPPPGATVIDAKAPKPITIVTRVPAPATKTIVVRTTQSGKPVP